MVQPVVLVGKAQEHQLFYRTAYSRYRTRYPGIATILGSSTIVVPGGLAYGRTRLGCPLSYRYSYSR